MHILKQNTWRCQHILCYKQIKPTFNQQGGNQLNPTKKWGLVSTPTHFHKNHGISENMEPDSKNLLHFNVYINWKYSMENIHRCVWVRNEKEGKTGGNRSQKSRIRTLYFWIPQEKMYLDAVGKSLSKDCATSWRTFYCCNNLPFATFWFLSLQ